VQAISPTSLIEGQEEKTHEEEITSGGGLPTMSEEEMQMQWSPSGLRSMLRSG
jgi:hypothetical protein